MAFPVGNTVIPGYPMPVGDKYMVMFDHTGPASYTQFVAATGANGDIINATSGGLGMGGFDFVDVEVDTTGQIAAYPVISGQGYPGSGAGSQVTLVYWSLVTATLGGQSQTTGTQIAATTNLSTFSWRIKAIMV